MQEEEIDPEEQRLKKSLDFYHKIKKGTITKSEIEELDAGIADGSLLKPMGYEPKQIKKNTQRVPADIVDAYYNGSLLENEKQLGKNQILILRINH
jgi:hypothetical protein